MYVRPHCERGEAIQHRKILDCVVAYAPRNDDDHLSLFGHCIAQVNKAAVIAARSMPF
jgi:hypothetical protein